MTRPGIRVSFAALAMLAVSPVDGGDAGAGTGTVTDLLSAGERAWVGFDRSRWSLADGVLTGRTPVLDGARTDPDASIFLVSRRAFEGNLVVSMDITFDAGRYVGVYLDFDQESQTGIWIATGHELPESDRHHVESGYIKSVDDGHWIVRATGELDIHPDKKLSLRFVRNLDDYSLWHDDRLVATWRKPGGYPAGPLQLRLTNAHARIDRLEVSSDRVKE